MRPAELMIVPVGIVGELLVCSCNGRIDIGSLEVADGAVQYYDPDASPAPLPPDAALSVAPCGAGGQILHLTVALPDPSEYGFMNKTVDILAPAMVHAASTTVDFTATDGLSIRLGGVGAPPAPGTYALNPQSASWLGMTIDFHQLLGPKGIVTLQELSYGANDAGTPEVTSLQLAFDVVGSATVQGDIHVSGCVAYASSP